MTDQQADLPRLEIRDVKVMRALAHPARLAIMEHLMTGVAATATECAEICALSPSATSYHLRALEKFGLVGAAPSRGDGRERLWQSKVRGLTLDSDGREDADTLAAERDLVSVVLDRQEAQTRQWLANIQDESAQWRDAAAFTGGSPRLTAAELTELTRAILAVLQPYGEVTRGEDAPPDSRTIRVIFRAFPAS